MCSRVHLCSRDMIVVPMFPRAEWMPGRLVILVVVVVVAVTPRLYVAAGLFVHHQESGVHDGHRKSSATRSPQYHHQHLHRRSEKRSTTRHHRLGLENRDGDGILASFVADTWRERRTSRVDMLTCSSLSAILKIWEFLWRGGRRVGQANKGMLG